MINILLCKLQSIVVLSISIIRDDTRLQSVMCSTGMLVLQFLLHCLLPLGLPYLTSEMLVVTVLGGASTFQVWQGTGG